MPEIAIIGTTTWGITLGVVLADKGIPVGMWARTEQEAINHKNAGPSPKLLPDTEFPANLSITSSLPEAMYGAKLLILAVPAQAMRSNIRLIALYIRPSMLIVNAAKGLEMGSGKRMSEVISEEIDAAFWPSICALSGPNLAREILLGLPAAAVVAAAKEPVARTAQQLLTAPNFCVYTNTDIIGVELGGALKNIIALGAGMLDGLGYGDNAKAAFVTRGLTEITALGVTLGANPLTFAGLAGLGDLITTCASPLSRNHFVGSELTKGRCLEEITGTMTGVAEGVSTTLAVWKLAHKLGLEMPITEKIYRVLYQGMVPSQAVAELVGAEGRHELAGRKWQLFSFLRG